MSRELSDSRPVYIACFPNREDNILQFQHKTQGVSPEFGPFVCTISSNEFIVAAPVSLSMNLLAVPRDLTIYALNVYIQQYVTIAPSSSTETHTVASSKAYILREGSTSGYATEGFATAARDQGLIVLDGQHMQGECWDWSRIARLPMSDKIRPTTLPGTDSPLRFQSELVFEIVFSREPAEVANPKIKIATLFNKRVTIASCCCMMSHLTLPLYSEPTPTMQGKDRKSIDCLGCMCDEMWDVLELRERELNKVADETKEARTQGHRRLSAEEFQEAIRPKFNSPRNTT